MTRQLAFLVLLIVSSLYAAVRGGKPERLGAATLLAGALLSVCLAQPFVARFRHVETGILLVDLTILGILLWLSLRSTRFWPIWIAALVGAEICIHLMRLAFPREIPQAYMTAIGLWSWAAQLLLMIATLRHRRRLKILGADAPWKS